MIEIKNSLINEDKVLFKRIIESNVKRWLDDFPENHFLIKALNENFYYKLKLFYFNHYIVILRYND